MTNRLQYLEAQIRGLPDQDALRAQLEVFRNVAGAAEERLAEFTKGKQQLEALRTISGNSLLLQSELARWQKIGANNSRDIVGLLRNAAPQQTQITSKLVALSKMTDDLKGRIAIEWKGLCEAHQERAQTFKSLAVRLDPTAASRLQEAAMRMRPDFTPLPTDGPGIQVALDARETLNRIMGSLQIEGPVESFLQAALQGTAEAAALLDPQVRDYLDNHPSLWRSLKVVLK